MSAAVERGAHVTNTVYFMGGLPFQRVLYRGLTQTDAAHSRLAGVNPYSTSQADIPAHDIGMRRKAAFEETLLLSRETAVLTELSWLAIGHDQQHCETGAL